MLVVLAGAVCLFGSWVGMRHFARARATDGSTRYGWLFMASVGTGAALWASTFISILALDPVAEQRIRTARHPRRPSRSSPSSPACSDLKSAAGIYPLAPELGGLVMGSASCHALHRAEGLAYRGHHLVERIRRRRDASARTRSQRALGQSRQPSGDALVPPWRRDRAGVHDLRHALRADATLSAVSRPGAAVAPGSACRPTCWASPWSAPFCW